MQAMMAVVLQQVILLAMAVTFSRNLKRFFIKDFAGKHKYAILVMAIKCLPVWIFPI